MTATLIRGTALDALRDMPDESIDAIVTDPPYGLANTDPRHTIEALSRWLSGDREFVPSTGGGFMGAEWDAFVPPPAVWDECARVLKPGGHLLAFAGSRTYDLMGLAIRIAGFEIRDGLAWLYSQGFPKSLNVSEAMERFLAEGPQSAPTTIRPGVYEVTGFLRAARDAAGWTNARIDGLFGTNGMAGHWTSLASRPQVPSVRQWERLKAELGFGDDVDHLVAELAATERPEDWGEGPRPTTLTESLGATLAAEGYESAGDWGTALKPSFEPVVLARKPTIGTNAANILAYGTGALNIGGTLIGTSGGSRSLPNPTPHPTPHFKNRVYGRGSRIGVTADSKDPNFEGGRWPANVILDGAQADELDLATRKLGGASRFFYVAKAGTAERPEADGVQHPTVKPLTLMRWLLRLVVPPGGVVLDPFVGSGTTLEAAVLERIDAIGVEAFADYWPLIEARLARSARDEAESLF